MLFDSHTHSCFSPDADRETTVQKMSHQAELLGLDYITVTDHCDVNFFYPQNEYDYPDYQIKDKDMFGSRDYSKKSIDTVLSLKQKYKNLLCGIELGQPLQSPDNAKQMLSIKGLDFVIGSLHMISGRPDFYWIEYDKMDRSEIYHLLESYFCELLDMAKLAEFDSLGHLTYPLRYIEGEHGMKVDTGRFDDIIREIFCTLIYNGKGIEINTSGLRQRYGKPFPDKKYLGLYRESGGEIVTIGSDAHKIADIGKGIPESVQLLKECGFKYAAVYIDRKPKMVSL
ncbi:MAG: histidinol-phosphatase HisJ family protein [Ruminococcus sp.]|nr:histidinol-phosphatase HisJ family protein [Ruminococcus sp.]